MTASVGELQPKFAYSREEAAELMSISIRTLDYLTANGELPTRKVGRRVLITRGDIEKFFRRDHQTMEAA